MVLPRTDYIAQNTGMNPKVDAFLSRNERWREELKRLRALVLDCGLNEELKWGKPCYSIDGHNVVLAAPFKNYCALLFLKGGLLKDPAGLLVKAGENSYSARQIRFTDARGIDARASDVKAYVRAAVAAEKAGLKAPKMKSSELVLPAELKKKFASAPALKTTFAALTPGRRRAYVLYFSAAKQSATREARIAKCAPRILKGLGLDD
jgi:uncharacterized protein YdeI (YjbR/CyaY-like superfamily)